MEVIASEMIEQHMEGDGIEPKAETPIDTFGCLNCNAFFQRMFLYWSDTISLMFIQFDIHLQGKEKSDKHEMRIATKAHALIHPNTLP